MTLKARRFFFFLLIAAFTVSACERKQDAVHESQNLTDYLTAYHLETLRQSPETVTYNGVPADIVGVDLNARLDDYSPAGDAKIRAGIKAHYEKLLTFDRDALEGPEKTYFDIALTLAERDLERIDGPGYYTNNFLGYAVYPVTQLSGPQMDIPKLLQSQHPMKTPKDAQDFISRLKVFAGVLDDTSALLQRDEAMGYILPTFALDKTVAYIEGMTRPGAQENPLYKVFTDKVSLIGEIDGDQRRAFETEVLSVLEKEVFPAYERMREVLLAQRPRSRPDAGLWAQPGGDALYAKMARAMGDTDLSPEEIHQLGLSEVARITAEMDDILKAQGYNEGTVGERLKALGAEKRFIYPNTDEGKARLIDDLNAKLNDMKARLPEYFNNIPSADVVVKRIPKFSEATDPGGFYDGPSLDGTRPGIYWINLRDTAETPSWQLPSLTYHESVPGHHFEVAGSVTATDRPLFRRLASFNSYSEGWALYAENLAAEMGVYDNDPFGNLGRLQGELYRAVRLVVDTGMHFKRWTREQAIDYMAATTGTARSSVVTEIERYAVWPGQALGYKLGMLKIQDLRRRAEDALGAKFDIRAFHEVILGEGPMPMSVVERRVDDWIASQV